MRSGPAKWQVGVGKRANDMCAASITELLHNINYLALSMEEIVDLLSHGKPVAG